MGPKFIFRPFFPISGRRPDLGSVWATGIASLRILEISEKMRLPGGSKRLLEGRQTSTKSAEKVLRGVAAMWRRVSDYVRRRTNVQQLTCDIDPSSSFYYLFFSFVLLELKPFVLKGKVPGEK